MVSLNFRQSACLQLLHPPVAPVTSTQVEVLSSLQKYASKNNNFINLFTLFKCNFTLVFGRDGEYSGGE